MSHSEWFNVQTSRVCCFSTAWNWVDGFCARTPAKVGRAPFCLRKAGVDLLPFQKENHSPVAVPNPSSALLTLQRRTKIDSKPDLPINNISKIRASLERWEEGETSSVCSSTEISALDWGGGVKQGIALRRHTSGKPKIATSSETRSPLLTNGRTCVCAAYK